MKLIEVLIGIDLALADYVRPMMDKVAALVPDSEAAYKLAMITLCTLMDRSISYEANLIKVICDRRR